MTRPADDERPLPPIDSARTARHYRPSRRVRLRTWGRRVLVYGILMAASMLFVLPFATVISSSFKEMNRVFEYPPQWIPNDPYFGSYDKLLFHTGFFRWMANTLGIALAVTGVKLLIDSMAGYALAKLQLTGKKIIFFVLIASFTVPFGAVVVPLYAIADALGITNSLLALFLPLLANPIGIFLMRQFILELPRDLLNSARIDGVSELGIYARIVLPMIKPGLVVLAVITFTGTYFMYLWPLVAVSSGDLQVLTTGVTRLRILGSLDYSVWSAAAVVAIIPIALVFFALQRQFLAQSIVGAFKR